MTINENSQWGLIRKTLSDEQADILDDVFASSTDEEVLKNAQRLYEAKGVINLAKLGEELDEQQRAFIGLIMRQVQT